jgi:hypothetical protein
MGTCPIKQCLTRPGQIPSGAARGSAVSRSTSRWRVSLVRNHQHACASCNHTAFSHTGTSSLPWQHHALEQAQAPNGARHSVLAAALQVWHRATVVRLAFTQPWPVGRRCDRSWSAPHLLHVPVLGSLGGAPGRQVVCDIPPLGSSAVWPVLRIQRSSAPVALAAQQLLLHVPAPGAVHTNTQTKSQAELRCG